jgi:hypothetical protein
MEFPQAALLRGQQTRDEDFPTTVAIMTRELLYYIKQTLGKCVFVKRMCFMLPIWLSTYQTLFDWRGCRSMDRRGSGSLWQPLAAS